LALLLRTLMLVDRIGPFTRRIASRLRFLAWFVPAGSAIAAAGQDVARSYFVATAVTDQVPVLVNTMNSPGPCDAPGRRRERPLDRRAPG
jgi:hypothetical protein